MKNLDRRVAVSLLLAVTVLAVGCSSSSSAAASTSAPTGASAGLSATAYVNGVCGAFQDFANAVKQRQDAFKAAGTDIAAVKQAWLDFLDGMVQDTQAIVTKIQSLGVPDVSDGQAAASTLKGEFSTLQSDIQSLRDQSADLPTTSEAAFAAAFQPILQKFQTDLTGFGQELSKFTGDKLDAAFSKAPECANLSASSSP